VERVRLEIRGQERGGVNRGGGVKEKPIFYPPFFQYIVCTFWLRGAQLFDRNGEMERKITLF